MSSRRTVLRGISSTDGCRPSGKFLGWMPPFLRLDATVPDVFDHMLSGAITVKAGIQARGCDLVSSAAALLPMPSTGFC